MRPDQTLNWMHHGTERLLAEVARAAGRGA